MTEPMRVGIIGGGLAGLSLGLALADIPNLSVCLFEKKSQPNESGDYLSQYDARSIALASGSLECFESMGVWADLSKFATPITQINIHRAGSWGRSKINAVEESVPALGHVIEAPRLAQALVAKLQKKSSVTLNWNARITSVSPKQDGYAIFSSISGRAEQGDHLDLLVIADGLASQGCERLGIERRLTDYGQQALVCNLDLAEPLQGIATEYFTANGVIALLPLNEGATEFVHRAALVWVTNHQGRRLASMQTHAFISELENFMSNRFKFKQLGKRVLYPLQGSHVEELVRANLMVMGSAAVGLHPVAAQGFNLALRDVCAIRDMLSTHCLNDCKSIEFSTLAQYAVARQQDHARVRQFIHCLLKTYAGASSSVPESIQSLSLLLFDLIPGLKQSLAQFAMGARRSSPNVQRVRS